MSVKLPSISDLDSNYASDEKDYIFENPEGLSVETLINHILPVPEELSGVSVKIPGTAKPGFSEIYRNGAFPNGLKSCILPELDTYHAIFNSGVSRHPNSPCLAYHEFDYENDLHLERYATISYTEVQERKKNLVGGLFFLLESNNYKDLSLEAHQKIVNHSRDYKSYDKDNFSFVVTFYSGNRPEWIIADLACSSSTITSTALYDTLGPKSSKFILEVTESPVIIASKSKISNLINLKKKNPQDLKALIMMVSMDPLTKHDAALIKEADANKIKVFDIHQVEKIGAIFPREETPPHAESIFTITFTSGTTGANPKGVVLAQKAAAAAISSISILLPHHSNFKEFSFLPLAHIFERHMSASVFLFGGSVAFPRLGGTPLTLFEDLKLWKPTFMANVPRIFSKIEASIKAATVDSTSKLNRALYSQAFEKKRQKQLENGNKGEHFIYDQTLIKKLRKNIGFDNIEYCFTGGAPISPDTIKFLKSSLGIGFSQGYGSSESFAGVLMALPLHSSSTGTCGAISPCVEARLRDLPEMGYRLTDKGGPRGEMLLRGPQMFAQYFKNIEETEKATDKEGWFSTGDVVQITEAGYFVVIDRVKNFFKLAQGEYVTPEKIENTYLTSNSILTQVYAHGNSMQSYLVGIVGIDPVTIVPFLRKQCNVTADLSNRETLLEICNKRDIRTHILLYINTNVGSKLNGFEKLHNVFFDIEPLRLERDVITPTSKLKRPVASKFFKPQINAMYEEGSILKNLKL
ncbi:hypothetical protein KGF56_000615 [Candida oxycetoniae]|uniref:AMP-dependent synthetase/ligase domain-containing protein n=1 Tax=Candida oxycetoniae TaxID=497107 RepID=A0AAI9T0E1_9ASCO|nr:uncharacterized protein KGF56_000615 [Candida oxycetoniae]KAI3406483.2 hypothetical protein KGF56_000615 [Candida oxycetoniae]